MNFAELNEDYPNENKQRFMQSLLFTKPLPLAFGRDPKVGKEMGTFIVKKNNKMEGFWFPVSSDWREVIGQRGAGRWATRGGITRSSDWFGEHIWLCMIDLALGIGAKNREAVNYGQSPDYPGLIATEVVDLSPIIIYGLASVCLYI